MSMVSVIIPGYNKFISDKAALIAYQVLKTLKYKLKQ